MMERLHVDEFVDLSVILGSGVYALLFANEIVYIGKAKRLLARIYAHRNILERRRAGVRGIKAVNFSKVKVFPCAEHDLDRIEKDLIARYQPRYNSQGINPVPLRQPIMLNIGGFEIALGGVSKKPELVDRRD